MIDKINTAAGQTKHSYGQIMTSKRYAGQRDLLAALLDQKESYTTDEVDAQISGFMERMVK